MKGYVPKILLCGDKAEFLAEVGERPFKIVGHLELSGEIEGQQFNFLEDGKFSINGKLRSLEEMNQILTGGNVDFVVFQFLKGENLKLYNVIFGNFIYNGCAKSQLLTTFQFKKLPKYNFYDNDADAKILSWLEKFRFKTLLDYDGHFIKSQILTAGTNDTVKIDCIFDGDILPVKKNIYRNIYQKSLECRLRHYDAILIEAQTPLEFDSTFFTVDNSTDAVITFVRYNSKLQKHILSTLSNFSKVSAVRSSSGEWLICYRHKPPEDFSIYVVTHKALPSEHVENLPEGYSVIHAGREISQDLGYIGDNTGYNISYLNPYINEITALYWIWKNTSHTIIGLSHYRRFFTISNDTNFSYDKILTHEAANKILETYDIILVPHFDAMFEIENIISECGENKTFIAKRVIAKNIKQVQPEYLDAFEFVMNTQIFYKCNMFITRRNIFDAYCRWLFSFYIDAVNEVLRLLPLDQSVGKPKRLMGYFAERMVTTWILKNNLRVKELDIIQMPY